MFIQFTCLVLAAAPLGTAELGAALKTVRDNAAKKQPSVVVFDLDSTVLNNGPRSRRILLETALAEPKLRWYAERIAALPDDLPYSVDEILSRAGILDKADLERFRARWRRDFFSDAYCAYDSPIRGAVEYTSALAKAGAHIVYFTGRDAERMGLGTVASLSRLGFPFFTAGSTLLMKPDKSLEDARFKSDAVTSLSRLGEVVATFENEPENANLFQKTWPKARNFLLNTNADSAKKVKPSEKLIAIDDFNYLTESSPASEAKR